MGKPSPLTVSIAGIGEDSRFCERQVTQPRFEDGAGRPFPPRLDFSWCQWMTDHMRSNERYPFVFWAR